MKNISFVIPCYCSEHMLSAVVDEIKSTMETISRYEYEIVLVDDCSPDGTYAVICELASRNAHITGISMSRNFGQHAALMAGFHFAQGDIVVCLDDDGQTPASEVEKLLEKIEANYDVVFASYERKMQSPFRNWGSWTNSKMTEIMLGKPHNLVINSYFAMRRFVMLEMLRYEHCYPYVAGLVLRTTKNICNVPVLHRQREYGQSGYTMKKLLSLWMNGFTSFSVKPLRIAIYFGVMFALLGFAYLAAIIVKYCMYSTAPLGWSSTIAAILAMGGIILVVLGLIGEYVGRIFMCINRAPQYVIREVTRENEN